MHLIPSSISCSRKKRFSTVWDLVGLVLVLVGSAILLDNCVELYILVCNGQNWTNVGLQSIVCIRKNIKPL
jgi:hypothetical protein